MKNRIRWIALIFLLVATPLATLGTISGFSWIRFVGVVSGVSPLARPLRQFSSPPRLRWEIGDQKYEFRLTHEWRARIRGGHIRLISYWVPLFNFNLEPLTEVTNQVAIEIGKAAVCDGHLLRDFDMPTEGIESFVLERVDDPHARALRPLSREVSCRR